MKRSMIITIVVVLVVGGGSFFAGMKYQQMQRGNNFRMNGEAMGNFPGRQDGQRGQFGGRNGMGGAVMGEILSQDDKSITVKLTDGSSKIVLLSGTTEINKTATGSASDLKTGEKVAVFGQTNSDGSVTAQSVQLNLMIRGGMMSPNPK